MSAIIIAPARNLAGTSSGAGFHAFQRSFIDDFRTWLIQNVLLGIFFFLKE